MNKSKTLISLAVVLVAVTAAGMKQAKAVDSTSLLAETYSSNQTVSGTVKGKIYIVKNGTNVPLKYIKVRIYQRENGVFTLKNTVLTNETGNYSQVLYFDGNGAYPEVKVDPVTTYWEGQGYNFRNAARGFLNPFNPLVLNFVGRK
jgi:hypothetical protein